MPRHSRNEVRAGAVILAALILLCFGIAVIGDFDRLFGKRVVHSFLFRKVEGLKVNDDVMYAGLKVGRVIDIDYVRVDRKAVAAAPGNTVDISPPQSDNVVAVLVRVELDANTPLQTGDEPAVSRGLTGTVYIDIVPGKEGGKPLTVTSRIEPLRGKDVVPFGEAIDHANGAVAQVKGLIGPAEGTLQNADNAITELRAFLRDNRGKLDDTIDHALSAVVTIDNITREVAPKVNKILASVQDSAGKAQQAIGKFNEKLDAVAASLQKPGNALTQAIIENRRNLDMIVENMREASARLSIGIEDLRRNPWKLLTRNIEADAYTQNIYDAARSFSEGASALAQASASLESIVGHKEMGVAEAKDAAAKLAQLVADMQKLEAQLYEALKNRPK